MTLRGDGAARRFCVFIRIKHAKTYGTIICYLLLSFVVCLKFVYGIWKKWIISVYLPKNNK